MAILKWYGNDLSGPFRELERMRNHMENVYDAFASGINQFRKNYTGVFPLVNLSEDEEKLYLTAELPGFFPDNLDLSIKGDTLILKGNISPTGEEQAVGINFHRRERESGSFGRSLNLPVKVNADGVEASFKNGILTVTLPKAAEARAHQIEVRTQ